MVIILQSCPTAPLAKRLTVTAGVGLGPTTAPSTRKASVWITSRPQTAIHCQTDVA